MKGEGLGPEKRTGPRWGRDEAANTEWTPHLQLRERFQGSLAALTRCFAEIGPRSCEACVLLGLDVGQEQIRDLSVSLQPCTWSSRPLPMHNTFLSPSKIFCEKMASERKLCDVLAMEVKSLWFLSARIQTVYGGYLNLSPSEGLRKSISWMSTTP